eukprot:CAMPEP_0174263158 /NCGR_PEP_ID=MMETSP0439-20130205/17400_1 /TAXON_ID=0 /ORGANISM="Stereomyxa ramosa, Strain Chinc5" /LENGTH=56 /DNA_ID=CAMNT_0015348345 /DNA_START=65 /DNA_END=235 /DNA_ORIENTATION=-
MLNANSTPPSTVSDQTMARNIKTKIKYYLKRKGIKQELTVTYPSKSSINENQTFLL